MLVLYTFLGAIVKIIGYSMFLYSLWMIVSPYLENYFKGGYRKFRRRREIKRIQELNKVEGTEKEKGSLNKHIDLLLSSLYKKGNYLNVGNFFLLLAILFLTTFITLFFMLDDPLFSALVALFICSLPYIYLRFLLANQRLKVSYAFMQEYHIFLQNYQSTGKDIYYTILNVNKEIEDKDLKKSFMKLLSSMQKERGKEDFKKAVKVFTYSINSTSAMRFGKLLEIAHLENGDISLSLLDLNQDIKKRKQDMEKDKTQKVETVLLGYSSLFLLPLFLYMGYRVAGVLDFWYIFTRKLPFTVFVLSCILTIISVFSAYLLSKPRADV